MNSGVESHAVYHPLDIFLNGTPKYTLPGSGITLSPNVISRVWNPMSYQGVRYIPTYPVPWLPNFWPQDVTMWPQCLLPFRRTFAAVDSNERLKSYIFYRFDKNTALLMKIVIALNQAGFFKKKISYKHQNSSLLFSDFRA